MKKYLFNLTILLLFCFDGSAADMVFTPERIIDGDTIAVKERVYGLKLKIRVAGIDTPEKGWRAKCEEEQILSKKAFDFTASFVSGNKFKVSNMKWGKYGGRIVGEVSVYGTNLGEELIRRGLAKPYDGGKKESWCLK